MFTTPCFIRKNTAELREKLETLGYKSYGNPFQVADDTMIFTTIDGFYVPYVVADRDNSWYDCGDNEDLFLALAALRDDTDYRQWFVFRENVYEYDENRQPFIRYEEGQFIRCFHNDIRSSVVTQATPEELITYFKKEE